jgi:hypothetical protein
MVRRRGTEPAGYRSGGGRGVGVGCTALDGKRIFFPELFLRLLLPGLHSVDNYWTFSNKILLTHIRFIYVFLHLYFKR